MFPSSIQSLPEGLLCFLHIPKVAGTTLRNLLADVYAEEQTFFFYPGGIVSPPERKHDPAVRLLIGHWYFGLHEELDAGGKRLFCFLRDPVRRVISQFNYSTQLTRQNLSYVHPLKAHLRPGAAMHDVIRQSQIKLFENQMVRQIAGVGKKLPDCPFGATDESILATAIRNLDLFEFVGFQETFEADLRHMCAHFGLPKPAIVKRMNVGRSAGKEDPASSIPYLQELNRHDEALYRYAWEKWGRARHGEMTLREKKTPAPQVDHRPAPTIKTLPIAHAAVLDLSNSTVRGGSLYDPAARVETVRRATNSEIEFHLESGAPRAGDFAAWRLPIQHDAGIWYSIHMTICSPYCFPQNHGRLVYQVLLNDRLVLEEDVSLSKDPNDVRIEWFTEGTASMLQVRVLARRNCESWNWGKAARIIVRKVVGGPSRGCPVACVTATSAQSECAETVDLRRSECEPTKPSTSSTLAKLS